MLPRSPKPRRDPHALALKRDGPQRFSRLPYSSRAFNSCSCTMYLPAHRSTALGTPTGYGPEFRRDEKTCDKLQAGGDEGEPPESSQRLEVCERQRSECRRECQFGDKDR